MLQGCVAQNKCAKQTTCLGKLVSLLDEIQPYACMERSELLWICVNDKPIGRLSTSDPVGQLKTEGTKLFDPLTGSAGITQGK